MEYKGFEFVPGTVFSFVPPEKDTNEEITEEHFLEANQDPFTQFIMWLSPLLTSMGLEGDVYAPYIWGTLENDGDLDGVLADISPHVETASIAAEISFVFRSMMHIDEIDKEGALELENGHMRNMIDAGGGNDGEFYDCPLNEQLESTECELDHLNEYNEEGDLEDYQPFDFTVAAFELEEHLLSSGDEASKYNFSADSIWQALHYSCGDISSAARTLQKTWMTLTNCRPCRHLLQGGCFRKDCIFNHQLSAIPCRYWLLEGTGCVSDECPFSHSVSSHDDTLNNLTEHLGSLAINDESCDNFPKLSSGSAVATASQAVIKSYSSVTKMTEKTLSYKDAAVMGVAAGGALKDGDSKITSRFSSTRYRNNARQVDVTFSMGEWVQSGKIVAASYEKYRLEARQNAIARNRLLQEATAAYLSGNKDVARALSRKGQAINNLMKECHLQAAKEIFKSNNNQVSMSNGQIDIHGLHVSEMIACMDELLPHFLSRGLSGTKKLRIVTGSGHHTAGPQKGTARLLPALVQYLNDLEVAHSYVLDPNGIRCGVAVNLL